MRGTFILSIMITLILISNVIIAQESERPASPDSGLTILQKAKSFYEIAKEKSVEAMSGMKQSAENLVNQATAIVAVEAEVFRLRGELNKAKEQITTLETELEGAKSEIKILRMIVIAASVIMFILIGLLFKIMAKIDSLTN